MLEPYIYGFKEFSYQIKCLKKWQNNFCKMLTIILYFLIVYLLAIEIWVDYSHTVLAVEGSHFNSVLIVSMTRFLFL